MWAHSKVSSGGFYLKVCVFRLLCSTICRHKKWLLWPHQSHLALLALLPARTRAKARGIGYLFSCRPLNLTLVQSAPLSALQPRVWTLWRMCVDMPRTHFYCATPLLLLPWKLPLDFKQNFPRHRRCPYSTLSTAPLPSPRSALCLLSISVFFLHVLKRCPNNTKMNKFAILIPLSPFTLPAFEMLNNNNNNNALFFSPSLHPLVCLQDFFSQFSQCQIWNFFDINFMLIFNLSNILVPITLGYIFSPPFSPSIIFLSGWGWSSESAAYQFNIPLREGEIGLQKEIQFSVFLPVKQSHNWMRLQCISFHR